MTDGGIVMAGIHHRVAPIGLIETARRGAEAGSPAAAVALGARGAVGVLTCHRVELYLEGVPAADAPSRFESWCGGGIRPLVLEGAGAARHLFRVAAGLEAAVLGDDQVLGQLRAAYAAACRGLHGGPVLHRLFHAAFRAGKRVRSETALAKGGRSVAGEAVALIARRLGGLKGRTVLVLGAGEMARVAAARLARRGAGRLLVANRSRERARTLASAVGGTPVPWPWRERVLAAADALLVATAAPEPVLGAEALAAAAGAGRIRIAVDLSMPRNLPAAGPWPGLETYDLSEIARSLEADRAARRASVAAAEAIVEEELARWLRWVRDRAGRGRGRARAAVACGER